MHPSAPEFTIPSFTGDEREQSRLPGLETRRCPGDNQGPLRRAGTVETRGQAPAHRRHRQPPHLRRDSMDHRTIPRPGLTCRRSRDRVRHTPATRRTRRCLLREASAHERNRPRRCLARRGMPRRSPPIPDLPLRWALLHVLDETCQHAGHADATRELLDGQRST